MAATLLIAEDDGAIRALMAEFLRDAGYDVVEAGNADEAMAVFESGAPIDLLFSDVRMPGSMDGRQLARTVGDKWPTTRVLLTSAYGGLAASDSAVSPERFLAKPYRPLSLLGELLALVEP